MLNRSLKKRKSLVHRLNSEGQKIANTVGVDLYQIRVKEHITNKKSMGYFLTLVTKEKETDDLIKYFSDRFKKHYNKKLKFKNYCNSTFKGNDCAMITFYYENNLFEKVI